MKAKTRINFQFLPIIAILFLMMSCGKDDDLEKIPVVSTVEISNIGHTTVVSGGEVTDDKGSTVIVRGVCWSTNQNPTVADQVTTDGTGAGSFTSSISGLTPNTAYYLRAYATNSFGTGYGSTHSFTTLDESIVRDIEGNLYPTVMIGNQQWMAENLRTTKYNDGTTISNVSNSGSWVSLNTGAYAWYNNDMATYANNYGALYNWYAVNTGKLCPDGWHVPTDEEWTILSNTIGGDGGSLKETGTALWLSPNSGATNSTGFSARPGGYRGDSDGADFLLINSLGVWWSATQSVPDRAWGRDLAYTDGHMARGSYFKRRGQSVRCVRD